MATTLQLRRYTTAELTSLTGAVGEVFVDLDKDTLVVQDGSTAGGKSLATETYVDTAISNLVDTAPGALDTLNELAAALGDDPNFAASVTSSLSLKLNSADFNSTFDTRFATKNLTNLGISDGTDGQVLGTDGSGNFSFVDVSGGGTQLDSNFYTAAGDLADGDLVWLDNGTLKAVAGSASLTGMATAQSVVFITGNPPPDEFSPRTSYLSSDPAPNGSGAGPAHWFVYNDGQFGETRLMHVDAGNNVQKYEYIGRNAFNNNSYYTQIPIDCRGPTPPDQQVAVGIYNSSSQDLRLVVKNWASDGWSNGFDAIITLSSTYGQSDSFDVLNWWNSNNNTNNHFVVRKADNTRDMHVWQYDSFGNVLSNEAYLYDNVSGFSSLYENTFVKLNIHEGAGPNTSYLLVSGFSDTNSRYYVAAASLFGDQISTQETIHNEVFVPSNYGMPNALRNRNEKWDSDGHMITFNSSDNTSTHLTVYKSETGNDWCYFIWNMQNQNGFLYFSVESFGILVSGLTNDPHQWPQVHNTPDGWFVSISAVSANKYYKISNAGVVTSLGDGDLADSRAFTSARVSTTNDLGVMAIEGDNAGTTYSILEGQIGVSADATSAETLGVYSSSESRVITSGSIYEAGSSKYASTTGQAYYWDASAGDVTTTETSLPVGVNLSQTQLLVK